MFLALLNREEQRAFSQLARHLIAADDVVADEEKRALAALELEMGLPAVASEALPPVDELAAVFSSRRSRIAALLELLGLAFSDAEFALNEESMIVVTAHAMDIEAGELAQLVEWVKEHVSLVERALAMMRH